MILSFTSKIWFYRDIVDFRKQLNGLIQLIVDCIEADPSSGELFIFRDRTGKKLKMVYFDGQSAPSAARPYKDVWAGIDIGIDIAPWMAGTRCS